MFSVELWSRETCLHTNFNWSSFRINIACQSDCHTWWWWWWWWWSSKFSRCNIHAHYFIFHSAKGVIKIDQRTVRNHSHSLSFLITRSINKSIATDHSFFHLFPFFFFFLLFVIVIIIIINRNLFSLWSESVCVSALSFLAKCGAFDHFHLHLQLKSSKELNLSGLFLLGSSIAISNYQFHLWNTFKVIFNFLS